MSSIRTAWPMHKVVCTCLRSSGYGEIRTFAVERIEEISLHDERFRAD